MINVKNICNKETFVLNLSLLVFLSIVVYFSPLRAVDELLLYTSDALTYYNAGSEVFNLTAKGDSFIRPYLFSSILYWGHQIGGAPLIVVFQSLLWLLSGNLIYFGLKQTSQKRWVPIVGVVLFALHLSVIGYIFHGLTELTSIFLISILSFITLQAIKKKFDATYFVTVTLILAILTVVKPLFYYPFIGGLIVSFSFYVKSILQSRKLIILSALALVTVAIQLFIMHEKYGVFKVSAIGKLTFEKYILAQTIQRVENTDDIELSKMKAMNMNSEEKKEFILDNKQEFFSSFRLNIKDNITGYGTSIITPAHYNVKNQVSFVSEYNKVLYTVFYVFLILFLYIVIRDFIQKKLFKDCSILVVGILFYYIIFTSGISFWQADRLVVFAIPLWITLYYLLIQRLTKDDLVHSLFRRKQV